MNASAAAAAAAARISLVRLFVTRSSSGVADLDLASLEILGLNVNCLW